MSKSANRRDVDLSEVYGFLESKTPQVWLDQAEIELDMLLIDHANCEKKAASTAMSMLYKYVDRPALLDKLSRLAREELRHFEQVLVLLRSRNIDYRHLSPSRYAGALMAEVTQHEPGKLIDTLIVGALIEARSCERFAALVPRLDKLDKELGDFYHSLLQSESRHFMDYLALARLYCDQSDADSGLDADHLQSRIVFFTALESDLITRCDNALRFHSGPMSNEAVVASE